MKKLFLTMSLLASVCLTPSLQAQELPVYLDETKPFMTRTQDLVSRMTLEEKCDQLCNGAPAIPRLGLPEYNWWNECLHGLGRAGNSTIFPQSIGLAATFNPTLIHDMADAISSEARAFYTAASRRGNTGLYTGLTFYSPNVNIFRDPRWGRGQETYGEDPYLTSLMGVAFVKGLQGDDEKYMKAAACAKHYAVHSGPEEFRHEFDAKTSFRDLHETYLPAFKALVKEGKVKSVMGAYNRVNGEAACASQTLLVDILRNQWGFDGYLTSDCGAIADIYRHHKLVKTGEDAAALALKATMNLNCGQIYHNFLAKAVKQGKVSEKLVDEMLCQLMVTRFELGLFDKPQKQPYTHYSTSIVDSKRHKDIAYQTAVESMVLLENKNNVLPLDEGDLRYLFITGPTATTVDALIGNYFGIGGDCVTFFEGLAKGAPAGVSIQYKQGVMLSEKNNNPIDWTTGEASNADAVVACVGLTWLLEGEEGESIASKQRGDMADNSLPAEQIKFLRKMKKKMADRDINKPLIVVVNAGCPVQLKEIKEIADAVIMAWYPGEAGGTALADLIMGRANFSGRTPVTFVKDAEQLPAFDDYNMTGRTYKYMTDEPLYPFGYGLSYSTFAYDKLEMPKQVKAGEALQVRVRVTNTSKIKGDEVVQLYITDDKANVPVPVRQLAAIQRVNLLPGESKWVTLDIAPLKMSLITDDNKRMIEHGQFTISVGGGQPIAQTASYVTGAFKVKGDKEIEL